MDLTLIVNPKMKVAARRGLEVSVVLKPIDQLNLILEYLVRYHEHYQQMVDDCFDFNEQPDQPDFQPLSMLDLHLLLEEKPNCLIESLVREHQQGREKSTITKKEDMVLIDQADVQIIKLQFMGMMVDISIGQVSAIFTQTQILV